MVKPHLVDGKDSSLVVECIYMAMVQLVQVLGNLYINFPPSFPLVNRMERHCFPQITHLPEEKRTGRVWLHEHGKLASRHV